MTDLKSFDSYLPPDIVALLRASVSAEFATVSAAGIPIDTPTFVFPDPALTTLDIGTGVAYPAKAERARKNPKVGMLFEGGLEEPVVSVAGRAAVYDANIQSNLERYLGETIFSPNVDPEVVAWESTRQRLYYLSRIIVAVAPVRIRWWPNRAAMDEAPAEWRADVGTKFPVSDPSPPGKASAAPEWPQRSWQELADQAVTGGMPAHLTLLDEDGYPLPIRVRSFQRSVAGFDLVVPRCAPWLEGKATLSFVGKEIFVGDVSCVKGVLRFAIQRALPILPMMDDRTALKPEMLAKLNARLAQEMERRHQALPVVPEKPPAPTVGALLREQASKAIDTNSVGAGISR